MPAEIRTWCRERVVQSAVRRARSSERGAYCAECDAHCAVCKAWCKGGEGKNESSLKGSNFYAKARVSLDTSKLTIRQQSGSLSIGMGGGETAPKFGAKIQGRRISTKLCRIVPKTLPEGKEWFCHVPGIWNSLKTWVFWRLFSSFL